MSEQLTKEDVKNQLEELGVQYQKLPITLRNHIADATAELSGKTYKVSITERIGRGIQIQAEGNEKSCLVTYEAMLGMAEAMGLFNEDKEQNNE